MLVQSAALVVGLLALVALWRALRPLLDALATDAADEIAAVSVGLAFATCKRCRAQTESDGAYCRACGGARVDTRLASAVCPSCYRDNSPEALFCPGCGTAAAPSGTPSAPA